jgi:hypothetical protein
MLGLLRVRRNLLEFNYQARSSINLDNFQMGKSVPIYTDFHDSAGVSSGHYFHQDLFFAREIFKANPMQHFDLGSRIDGFIAHLATFRDVNVFDIRPLQSPVEGIHFAQLDIMDTRKVVSFPKIQSLSCLHTAEHFGLGRYGDSIDFDGWDVGLQNLTTLLTPGGRFYFSVPIGRIQRIEFNAHRIFNPKFLTTRLLQDFQIDKTAAVRDDGQLDLAADLTSESFLNSFSDNYGCGLWVLTKR